MQSTPKPSRTPSQATAWLNIAAKIGGAAISFLLYIVLARMMSPTAFADVAVIFAWLALASAVACFSAPLVMVRHVPGNLVLGRADLARGVVQFLVLASLGCAVAIATLGAVALASGAVSLARDLRQSALVAAALLVPGVLLLDLTGLLISLKRAAVAELLVNIARPMVMLFGLFLLWLSHRQELSAPSVLAVYLAASILMVLVCVLYVVRVLPVEMVRTRPAFAVGEWARSTAGLMGVTVLVVIHERIDLLIMATIASPIDVAAYAVAVRFGQAVVIAATAAGTSIAPHVVECLADSSLARRRELQALVRDTARTALYLSLIALAGFALLGPFLLKLFGEQYERAYLPMVLLAAGQVASAMFGSATAFSALAGEPRIAITSLLCGIVVNAALNLVLVGPLGAPGAAVAAASAMVCTSAIAWGMVRRRFGLDASVFSSRAA